MLLYIHCMHIRYGLVVMILVLAKAYTVFGQASNIQITNPVAERILRGDFDTNEFPAGDPLVIEDEWAQLLIDQLEPDSLKQYLLDLSAFGNRNTGSDTSSSSFGMGAARRWAAARMEEFSALNDNRLQVGYIQFDQNVCGMTQHRNVLGVLPGSGIYAGEVILIEAHMDSRCANEVDSINVRLYSNPGSHKNFARYTKSAYDTRVAPLLAHPSIINLMSAEDRTGRGGDHIPFRRAGYTAIRFTSANEHGDANVADPDYEDRQHTSDDVLGLDTDGDSVLDSFFVDFRYLSRNALINGFVAGLVSTAPEPPQDLMLNRIDSRVGIQITDSLQRDSFTLGVRLTSSSALWDTLIRVAAIDTIILDRDRWSIAVAYVDERGISSLYEHERTVRVLVSNTNEVVPEDEAVELLPNYPNPFDEATLLRVFVNRQLSVRAGFLVVHDRTGKQLVQLPIDLSPGLHEVLYDFSNHNYLQGIYSYSLVVEGQILATRQMVYAY